MPYWLDGNNLIGQSAAAAVEDGTPRRAFLQLLSRYARSGGGRFLVFFDGEDSDRSMPPPGIQIRFSAPESADEAILRGLSGSSQPHEIIVVTNDRNLMVRSHDAGARTMTWRDFTQKRPPPIKESPSRDQDDRVDVSEWAEFFGLDPKNLK
jgi:predicted RNA-binding protein with PIN domain